MLVGYKRKVLLALVRKSGTTLHFLCLVMVMEHIEGSHGGENNFPRRFKNLRNMMKYVEQ